MSDIVFDKKTTCHMNTIKIFLFLVLLFHSSCKKDIQQSNPKTKAIGHGGMGIYNTIPINTFESISRCLFVGADGVEFDIQLTEDSVWVVYHDSELNPGTNMSGSLFDKPWDEMKDAYYMNPVYANYGLINADELLGAIVDKDKFVFSIDLKNYNQNTNLSYVRRLAKNYVELVNRHNISSNSYLSTSRISLLDKLNVIDSTLNLFFYSGANFQESLNLVIAKNYDGITIHIESLDKTLVDRAHNLGIEVAAFGANTTETNINAIEYGVDYIETDQLQNLLNLLN